VKSPEVKDGLNPPGYVRELYDFCQSQPAFMILPGKGAKQASFSVRSRSPGAPRTALFGVYAKGRIWPYFVDMPPQIQRQFRSFFSKIERLRHAAENKAWFEFVISDETELEIVKNSLRYLASVDWIPR
jgi:hypothetical protein